MLASSGNTPAHFVWHMCTGSTVHKDRCLPYSGGMVPWDTMLHSHLYIGPSGVFHSKKVTMGKTWEQE